MFPSLVSLCDILFIHLAWFSACTSSPRQFSLYWSLVICLAAVFAFYFSLNKLHPTIFLPTCYCICVHFLCFTVTPSCGKRGLFETIYASKIPSMTKTYLHCLLLGHLWIEQKACKHNTDIFHDGHRPLFSNTKQCLHLLVLVSIFLLLLALFWFWFMIFLIRGNFWLCNCSPATLQWCLADIWSWAGGLLWVYLRFSFNLVPAAVETTLKSGECEL